MGENQQYENNMKKKITEVEKLPFKKMGLPMWKVG